MLSLSDPVTLNPRAAAVISSHDYCLNNCGCLTSSLTLNIKDAHGQMLMTRSYNSWSDVDVHGEGKIETTPKESGG